MFTIIMRIDLAWPALISLLSDWKTRDLSRVRLVEKYRFCFQIDHVF